MLKELMAYKNLYYRIFLSLCFFGIYFISLNNIYLLFILGTCIYLIILLEVFKFFKNFFKIIFLYLSFSYLNFTIFFFVSYDYIIFNVFIFTIILFDTFSYFTGKFFGKNYMFKFISPKKTFEGYLGGIFFTNLTFLAYFYLINNSINFMISVTLINLTIFFSAIGDLIESYFKRQNNIKDSSKYLPGHGGFFDRFDSFITSIIMLNLFSLL